MTWLLTTIQLQRTVTESELMHDIDTWKRFPQTKPDDGPESYADLMDQLNFLCAQGDIERVGDGWKPVYREKPAKPVPRKPRTLFAMEAE